MMQKRLFVGLGAPLRHITRVVFCTALVLSCLAVCLLCSAAGTDNEFAYLEPKFINADGQLAPLYDTELASFLRLASSEAYDIGKEESNEGAGLSPVFEDIQLHSVEDESIKLYKTGPNGEELRDNLRITCNFLTSAKRFTVNGQEKNVVLISFRGSAELHDWYIDGQIEDNDGFHKGFLGCADLAFETLINEISYSALDDETFASVLEKAKDPYSGYYILVTGHSLGGAIANILTCRHLNQTTLNPFNILCYTFASPKVCNPAVADLYYSSNIINIKNNLDVVTHIGYLLTVGTTPGYTVSANATEDKGGFDILMHHSIGVVYKDILYQVNAAPAEFYPYLTRTKAVPHEIMVTCYSNHFENGVFVDNFIPPSIADRFFGHDIIVDGGTMGVYAGARLPNIIVRNYGNLTCNGNRKNTVAGDVIVESGYLEVGSGKLTVEGDLRLQTRALDGSFIGGSGHLIMEEAAGHITVEGDTWFQGGDSNSLYNPDMTAGTLEVKGDFYVLPSTGDQCEMVFLPKYDHKVLFSGTKPQTIYFAPYEDPLSYIVATFCHFETTNPHPLIVPASVSFQHLEDDLTFAGDVTLRADGDYIVKTDCTIKADNIYLEEDTHPEIYAHLTLNGNVQGGRLDIGEHQGARGEVTVTGDLTGTDLYFCTSETPSVIEVQGNYLNNNADLVLCDGQMIVRGDLRYQVQQEDGSYIGAQNPFASIYEGARLEVDGTLYLQRESGEDIGFPKELPCVLRGDLIQICDETNEEFWNYGLRNLVLAGDEKQLIDAPRLYFDELTLANTSREGVEFLHPLYQMNGVFNAYGRADGTITPYSFPTGWVPDWQDSDADGLPDCLDPRPLEETVGEMTAVLSDGIREEEEIRFLYAVISPAQLECTQVVAGIYHGGQLVEVQPVALGNKESNLQVLEILLADVLQADSVRIFQMDGSSFRPLWNAAGWQAP